MRTPNRFQRVFIIGAYLPNGGTLMAYHVGRILQRDFGIRAIAVSVADEHADHGIHAYDTRMPQISQQQMEHDIRDDDILIVNPSFSNQCFGWRLPGFKLCYVQGFNTYPLLDRRLDAYVAVSDFVADYLRAVYALDVPVIAPFIDLDKLPLAPEWEQRPAHLVLPYRKGIAEAWEHSWQRLRDIVSRHSAHITFAEPLTGGAIPQTELLARIGAVRYFLTLSAAEGFGLVPLEAMAMGATVIGYDGYGGRHYMRPDENCRVVPYAQIERVADMLIDAVHNPASSVRLAAQGRATAAGYDYATFRDAWIAYFSNALGINPSRH
ncbi:MAG TPA: glycosyltransferase [Rudaea sp.]|nr:glycosyltransferase [Rudaea sp.]